MLKQLILLLYLLNLSSSKWWMQGQWTQNITSNQTFLFSFLNGQTGYAIIHGDSRSSDLQIKLSEHSGDQKCIKMDFWMQTTKYMTDQIFHYSRSPKVTFESNGGSYGEQDIKASHISFNITYTHRKRLLLQSKYGSFDINLFDLQSIYPYICLRLWVILIAITLLSILSICFLDVHNGLAIKKNFEQNPGILSKSVLYGLYLNVINSIYHQIDFLSDGFWESLLAIVTFLVMVAFIIWLIALIYITCNFTSLDYYKQAVAGILLLICSIILLSFSVIRCWWILCFVGSFQFFLSFIVCLKQKISFSKSFGLLVVYLGPILLFPIVKGEINYSSKQAQVWWIYIIFCILDLISFYLKSDGGLLKKLKKMKGKYKGRVFLVKRYFNQQKYTKLQQNLCPICLKQVLVSDMQLNKIEVESKNWIQAECHHHFHKQCILQNADSLKYCIFDKIKLDSQLCMKASK